MRDFGAVAEHLRRSTVQVLCSGSGSGIIWDAAGLILTNAHVARDAGLHVELWDGTRLPARIIRRDSRQDLAMLHVPATGLPAASRGDSSALRAGELVIAVGNPLGFVGALSTGVVHTVGPFPGLRGGVAKEWVQSTVRLAPGNSGGPLANARGEVIGVNTMVTGLAGGANLALAITANTAQRFVSRAGGDGARIGVTVRPVRLAGENAVGFLILEVEPGLPADRASLQLGDVLTGVAGRSFQGASGLEDAITEASGTLALQFRRGGAKTARTATLLIPRRQAFAA